MQALLIYNPNSGAVNNSRLEPDQIVGALREAGYDPVYTATEQEDDLNQALLNARDLVVSAGGDGTLRAVATRLVGRNVPIAPLPMGTANNICRALDITGDPLELIAGLRQPSRRKFDVGVACFPWGKEYFLEAMGFGFYADALAAYRPEEGKSVIRSLTSLVDTLRNFQPHPIELSLDGRELSGEYLNVEIMNIGAFGPRIQIAPDAQYDDGLLDIVMVNPEERESVLSYIAQLVKGEFNSMPGVQGLRGARLDFVWEASYPLHVDGEVRPQGFEPKPVEGKDETGLLKSGKAWVTVEPLPAALEFWTPEISEKQ